MIASQIKGVTIMTPTARTATPTIMAPLPLHFGIDLLPDFTPPGTNGEKTKSSDSKTKIRIFNH